MVKFINFGAYFIFILYIVLCSLTSSSVVKTEGEVISVATVYHATASRYNGTRTYRQIELVLNENGVEKSFVLRGSDESKCDWENTSQITLTHHFFWYSAPWMNTVEKCQP